MCTFSVVLYVSKRITCMERGCRRLLQELVEGGPCNFGAIQLRQSMFQREKGSNMFQPFLAVKFWSDVSLSFFCQPKEHCWNSEVFARSALRALWVAWMEWVQKCSDADLGFWSESLGMSWPSQKSEWPIAEMEFWVVLNGVLVVLNGFLNICLA